MVPGGTEPADYSTAQTDKATIMKWIMDERFIELAGEGQRWFDLRRWQPWQELSPLTMAFLVRPQSTISFQPKHLFFLYLTARLM